jgi:hypothetical protein
MDRGDDPTSAETVAFVRQAVGKPPDSISRTSSSPSAEEGRFVPGTLLGGRYRIIALLGRAAWARSIAPPTLPWASPWR